MQGKYPKDTLNLGTNNYSSGRYTINHYKQNLDGSYPDEPTNSTRSSGGTFRFTNKYDGFTVRQYRLGNGTWIQTSARRSVQYSTNLYIGYERNRYPLTFYNHNTISKTKQVLFEQPLEGFASYTPAKPSGLPDAFIFQGWYKDKAFSEKFDFATETMPAGGLTIYAKWAAPEVKGIIHLSIGGTDIQEVELTYGKPIDSKKLPTVVDASEEVLSQGNNAYKKVVVPLGYTWLGWATKVGEDFVLWNFDIKVQGNIELYPYYVDSNQLAVTYEAGEGTGTAPVDNKKYAEGAYADLMSAGGLTAPDGKVFIGWKYGGKIY